MNDVQLKVPLKCPSCGFEKEYYIKAIPSEEDPNTFAIPLVCSKCNTPTTSIVTQEYVKKWAV